MTDTTSISLPQPSALRPQGWEVEVEVISENLTDEQRALVVQVKKLSAVVHMAGVERATRLMLLRESFPKVPPGTKGDSSKDRPGWEAFLRREFDANVRDVNREIEAIEAVGEKLDKTGSGPAHHLILQKLGSSHLNEIGRGSTPAIRRQVWDKLFDDKLNLNKRAIRAEVKEQNRQAGLMQLKPLKPSDPSKSVPPVLPSGSVASGCSRGANQLSIAKHGNLVPRGDDGRPDPTKPPLRETELNYLRGNDSANKTMAEKINSALKTGRSGKVAKIRALAEALHREFKPMGDRYQGAWDSDSNYPSYMHLWQHMWANTQGYALHEELDQIRKDIAEANRHFSIAITRLYAEGLEVTE